MKTGTPVRIDGRSVHYDLMETQDGENDFHRFSFMNASCVKLKQLQCWTCFTNEEVHDDTTERSSPTLPFSTDKSKVSDRVIALV